MGRVLWISAGEFIAFMYVIILLTPEGTHVSLDAIEIATVTMMAGGAVAAAALQSSWKDVLICLFVPLLAIFVTVPAVYTIAQPILGVDGRVISWIDRVMLVVFIAVWVGTFYVVKKVVDWFWPVH